MDSSKRQNQLILTVIVGQANAGKLPRHAYKEGHDRINNGWAIFHIWYVSYRSSDDQKCIEQWEDMIYNWKNWMEHRRAKVHVV